MISLGLNLDPAKLDIRPFNWDFLLQFRCAQILANLCIAQKWHEKVNYIDKKMFLILGAPLQKANLHGNRAGFLAQRTKIISDQKPTMHRLYSWYNKPSSLCMLLRLLLQATRQFISKLNWHVAIILIVLLSNDTSNSHIIYTQTSNF